MDTANRASGTDEDDRARLLDLLRRDGILYRSETQPVLSRDGTSHRWILDSLGVTLTPDGAALAARCLLRLLDGFEGRQLATLGLTGVPLVQGCVLAGDGRYSGVLVRKERKAHGSLKLIEGRLDPGEPVVIVDDSVSSGHAMSECADRLAEAGFHVEGGVCLVRFGYDRGVARLERRGLRVAAVFDVFSDIVRHLPGERPYPANPTKTGGEPEPSPRSSPPRPHPAHLAREAIAEYLRTGLALGAPDELDGDHDGAGGCWVSLRRKQNVHDRPARSGFWHFPGERRGTQAADVVRAAVQTARELAGKDADPLRTLDECAVAVTFFSTLERCTVGELDDDRYGIVVRSRERPPRMGGALPRMPGIANAWQQFAHAAYRNAKLLPLEAYDLYRHDVRKVVEPGAGWQPTGTPAPAGVPWHADATVAGPIAADARERVLTALGRADDQGPAPELPAEVDGVFVTVHADGRLAGCVGGFPRGDRRATAVDAYATAAVEDARFGAPAPDATVAVSVSLLFDRHEYGTADPDWVIRPTRFAGQALQVQQRDRSGLLLPSVAVTGNLTPRGFVDEVIDKAGITRPPYRWTRWECATWLADVHGVRPMENALPRGAPESDPDTQRTTLHRLLTGYARRHHVTDGEPTARYEVFADRLRTGLHPARLGYGAWVLARAGLTAEAQRDVRRLPRGADGWVALDDHPPSVAELAFLLLAGLGLGDPPSGAAELLAGRISPHGIVDTHRDAPGADVHQDYAPGQVLLALARAVELGAADPPVETVLRALRHYRRRFRLNRHWGAVAWLAQAYPAWGRVTGDPRWTEFGYEIVDHALGFQASTTGAFLNDHQSDTPGATTALYLEGVAAVRAAAAAAGDDERERRYRLAGERGLRFLDRLVYQERDACVLPNPRWAIGGVRTSLTASDVRIDYVHHALAAVLALDPGELS